jgi:hypothetical protein
VSIELSDDDWRELLSNLDQLQCARRCCINDGDIKESCRYDNRSREVERNDLVEHMEARLVGNILLGLEA